MNETRLRIMFFAINLILPMCSYANIGSTAICTKTLANLMDLSQKNFKGICHQGLKNEVSAYDFRNGILYIDSGTALIQKSFPISAAKTLLAINGDDSNFQDLYFNENTRQWVVEDLFQNSPEVELLPENFKNLDQIIALYNVKMRDVSFLGSQLQVQRSNGTTLVLSDQIPSHEELRKLAYENYDVPSTGWKYVSTGIKNYPIYDKIKAIVDECDSKSRESAKNRCFKKKQIDLAKDLLKSTLINDNKNTDLISALKNEERAEREDVNTFIETLVSIYRVNLSSQVLDPNYHWSSFGDHLLIYGSSTEQGFFYHYTYDFSRNIVFYSAGQLWTKFNTSVRGAYYPIRLFDTQN